jgi:hypothetical protein
MIHERQLTAMTSGKHGQRGYDNGNAERMKYLFHRKIDYTQYAAISVSGERRWQILGGLRQFRLPGSCPPVSNIKSIQFTFQRGVL